MGQRKGRSHYLGCLLGGAVGDALGAAIEFLPLAEIRSRFGPAGLTDYAPAHGREGAITDDTQLTLFTAEALIRAHNRHLGRGLSSLEDVARHAYLRWLHTQGARYGEGMTDRGWLVEQKELHAPSERARSPRGPASTAAEPRPTGIAIPEADARIC